MGKAPLGRRRAMYMLYGRAPPSFGLARLPAPHPPRPPPGPKTHVWGRSSVESRPDRRWSRGVRPPPPWGRCTRLVRPWAAVGASCGPTAVGCSVGVWTPCWRQQRVVIGKAGCCGASLRSAPHHPAFTSGPLEPPSNTHMGIGTPPYRPSQAPRGPFSEPPTPLVWRPAGPRTARPCP